MTTPLMLDLSRLLARAPRGAPTGIDRVEHAYAEQLLLQAPDRLQFVAIDKLDRLRPLPMAATRRFIAMVGAYWRGDGASAAEIGAAARMIWVKALLRPNLRPLPAAGSSRPFYLLVSHRHLHRQDRLERAIAASGARLVVFVHDLIPIELPEYCRPQHGELHLRRIRTVAALAEAVVVNSQTTAQALQPFLEEAGRAPPVLVAPLGVPSMLPAEGDGIAEPYFVYISTIEPRKNHLMLLQIWRRLGEMMGERTPRLVLVGRRGWEIENVIDMLERSITVRQHVTELTALTDARVGTLLRDSRALLYPSFAEGFGLPVAEALSAGTPVICSDLPVLRETGGAVPDYVDPLDARGWLEAITDYATNPAPRREAQLARMPGWRCAGWDEHVAAVLDVVGGLQTDVVSGGQRARPAWERAYRAAEQTS
jgi:glycosyltransferase involved in cell wall biosynthesis